MGLRLPITFTPVGLRHMLQSGQHVLPRRIMKAQRLGPKRHAPKPRQAFRGAPMGWSHMHGRKALQLTV